MWTNELFVSKHTEFKSPAMDVALPVESRHL